MQVAEEHYTRLGATPDSDQGIAFEADEITLDIPVTGKTVKRSWKLVPLMKPEVIYCCTCKVHVPSYLYDKLLDCVIMQVTKKEVDSFEEGKRIPHCALQVLNLKSARETYLHRVKLLGAKDSFIVIRLSPGASAESNYSQNSG